MDLLNMKNGKKNQERKKEKDGNLDISFLFG
jgi:hypothetical protein